MVLVSSKKRMTLNPLELVIRRCPVCLKDTEQDAFYANNPDFTAEAMTPTTPQFRVRVAAAEEHKMNWYIVSKCRECGHLYKVTGILQYKMKAITKPVVKDVDLALFFCDICYNEQMKYEPAEIFIKLSEGKNVYLCEKHAAEVGKEKEKSKSYASLIGRFNVWKINDAMPKAVQLQDGTVVVLVGDRGYMEEVLRTLYESDGLSIEELVGKMKEGSLIHKTKNLMESQIEALKSLGLIEERKGSGIFGKKHIFLTDGGRLVAGKL